MSSSLIPTDFNIKVTEEQVVRNSIIKHEVTHTISNVKNIDHRILTCPENTFTDLIQIDPTNIGAGKFTSGSLEYVRITNLDTVNNISIIFSGSQGNFTQEVSPQNSIFLSSPHITSSNFNGVLSDTLTSIQAYPLSASIDLEYTVVNS
jgi:hypothetical protein